MIIVPADEQSIRQAADIIRSGGLIAYPTETYYGLGVDPYNQQALRKLFAIKKRAAHLPILVLIADINQAERLAVLPLPEEFYSTCPPILARTSYSGMPGSTRTSTRAHRWHRNHWDAPIFSSRSSATCPSFW